jgi:hypothetical protein
MLRGGFSSVSNLSEEVLVIIPSYLMRDALDPVANVVNLGPFRESRRGHSADQGENIPVARSPESITKFLRENRWDEAFKRRPSPSSGSTQAHFIPHLLPFFLREVGSEIQFQISPGLA